MKRRYFGLLIAVLFLFLQACSSGNSGSTPYFGSSTSTGSVQVRLTDAPAYGYDHVWITVKAVWFNASADAGPMQPGWHKFPLASPVTFDLLDLSNGAISVPVLDDAYLPEGTYPQMRVLLAPTEDSLTGSATTEGLSYNNQVNVTGDTTPYPLRIPAPLNGIKLEGSFEVKKNTKLKIAVDFDAGHDVVKMDHDGSSEYVFKPRLASFDLDNAGAIVGHIDATAAANRSTAQFVIKAEQAGAGNVVHLVRRATFVADAAGTFVLYPLLPGNYDVLIRGIGYETAIIKGVPVMKGTTPTSGATVVPALTLTPSPAADYLASASITSPTGAWVDYFQTVPGDAPYEVRFRHFHPLTGQFADFPLSAGPLRVGAYNATSISLSTVSPAEGDGGFRAVANAVLYQPSAWPSSPNVSAANASIDFGTLGVKAPAISRSISGAINVPTMSMGAMNRGVAFAVHGGMIVNAVKTDGVMGSGGSYTLENLPGGESAANALPVAVYGVTAFGWSASNATAHAVAVPVIVDLSSSDATGADLDMLMLP